MYEVIWRNRAKYCSSLGIRLKRAMKKVSPAVEIQKRLRANVVQPLPPCLIKTRTAPERAPPGRCPAARPRRMLAGDFEEGDGKADETERAESAGVGRRGRRRVVRFRVRGRRGRGGAAGAREARGRGGRRAERATAQLDHRGGRGAARAADL